MATCLNLILGAFLGLLCGENEPPVVDNSTACADFAFVRPWTIEGDSYQLFRTAGNTGAVSDIIQEELTEFGPFGFTFFEKREEMACVDPNHCYRFLAVDGHDGPPFGSPRSNVSFDGGTFFFCTGDTGDGGDQDSCSFGDACP